MSNVSSHQALEYARTRSKATIVAEHGEEALLRPDLIYKNADGTAISDRITFSNAQGDAQGVERKRARDNSTNASEANVSVQSPSSESTERPNKAPRTEQAPMRPTSTDEEEDGDDDGKFLHTNAFQLWKLAPPTMTSRSSLPIRQILAAIPP